jgi:SAM-dependent methyltransferase
MTRARDKTVAWALRPEGDIHLHAFAVLTLITSGTDGTVGCCLPGRTAAIHPGRVLTAWRAGKMLADVPEAADHVLRNRAAWDRLAADYAGPAQEKWAAEPSWGIWHAAESQVGVLPPDLAGRDAIELGCGTGYISAWLARLGARPVGLDNSAAQLATARRLQEHFGLRFPLIHASAERAPFADTCFDLVISEYGASIWCDPYVWIPEAARMLRPGGELIFLGNSVLMMLTVPDEDGVPATERLLRPYFGMHRFEWPDDESVEFHLGHGDMIRLLRRCGLEVKDLLELRPGPDATTRCPFVTLGWSWHWPCEEVWKARKRS